MQLGYLLSNDDWLIKEQGFEIDKINYYETIFTLGNGYLGTRGSLEEGIKGNLSGTFIAGVFDHHDSRVIELANCPDWLPVSIWVNEEKIDMQSCEILDHNRTLDIKKGILHRYTRYKDSEGRVTRYESIRYASMANQHLYGIKAVITPENYSGDIRVESQINVEKYNLDRKPIYVPKNQEFHPEVKWEKWAKSKHTQFIKASTNSIGYCESKTIDTKHTLGYATTLVTPDNMEISSKKEYEKLSQSVCFKAKQGDTYQIEKIVSIYTSRDVDKDNVEKDCISHIEKEISRSFENRINENNKSWEVKWDNSDITITGDADVNKAVRFNIYHLLNCGNENDDRVSIAAKSLSGEGYKGHVFWDTEIFILPFFIYTQPDIAKALIKYRYNTLSGALNNAKENGYKGAQYAWESADTGAETTPKWSPDMKVRIWTGEKEIQITADVAYGVITYFKATNDVDFMLDCGLEILLQTARFWESRLEYNKEENRYEITDIIGPDEFHKHIDNNIYTNKLAQWNMNKSAEYYYWAKENHKAKFDQLIKKISISEDDVQKWTSIAPKIFLTYAKNSKLIEQYDGYFDLDEAPITEWDENNMPLYPNGFEEAEAEKTKLLKQPDVIQLLYVLPDEYDDETKKVNYDYYEQWTMHKSSLSPCIHSIMGIETGDRSKAMQYFVRSAFVDLQDNQKNTEWGIHSASTGGTWMAMVFGFGGMRVKNNRLTFKPWLPEQWSEISFKVKWQGDDIDVKISKFEISVKLIANNKVEPIYILDKEYKLESNKELTIAL